MSNQSIVSVCNISLLAIGSQATISNLTENSTQSNACSTLFTFIYEMLGRTAYWNCLRKQLTLTLLAAAQGTPENPDGTTLPLPPTPYLYSYQYPSDCLQARFIVPTVPSIGNNPISPAMTPAATWLPREQIPFHVAYATDSNGNPLTVILTNQTQAQLVYTVNQPNPQIWDPSFTGAMIASLAAWLVPALSLNLKLIPMQAKIAEGLIAQARIRDGDEGTTCQDHIPDWILARSAGSGYYNNQYFNNGGDLGAMSWPG